MDKIIPERLPFVKVIFVHLLELNAFTLTCHIWELLIGMNELLPKSELYRETKYRKCVLSCLYDNACKISSYICDKCLK